MWSILMYSIYPHYFKPTHLGRFFQSVSGIQENSRFKNADFEEIEFVK